MITGAVACSVRSNDLIISCHHSYLCCKTKNNKTNPNGSSTHFVVMAKAAPSAHVWVCCGMFCTSSHIITCKLISVTHKWTSYWTKQTIQVQGLTLVPNSFPYIHGAQANSSFTKHRCMYTHISKRTRRDITHLTYRPTLHSWRAKRAFWFSNQLFYYYTWVAIIRTLSTIISTQTITWDHDH